MGRLLICKPEPAVLVQASVANLERLLTVDPKEGFYFPADAVTRSIDLDFGVAVTLATFYLGYHNVVGAGPTWTVQTLAGLGGAVTGAAFAGVSLAALGAGDPLQSLVGPIAPLTARYWRVSINANNVAFYAGALALCGAGVQPSLGHEWDSGRLIDDTGTVERLVGGGFGIDEGVSTGGYQWSFDSLQPDELRALYRLARERRTTRTVLVVEDPDATDGLSERIHWSLFDRFEAYGRRDPSNTRWAFRVRDWG